MIAGMTNTELLPIPPINTAEDPAYTTTDLQQRWRALMGPLGFGERLLWFTFMCPDRRLLKLLHQVPLGARPKASVADNVMAACRAVVDDLDVGLTVVLLLTRPGRGPISEKDQRWAQLLRESADRAGVPLEPIFRANDESLVEVT